MQDGPSTQYERPCNRRQTSLMRVPARGPRQRRRTRSRALTNDNPSPAGMPAFPTSPLIALPLIPFPPSMPDALCITLQVNQRSGSYHWPPDTHRPGRPELLATSTRRPDKKAPCPAKVTAAGPSSDQHPSLVDRLLL